MKKLNLNQIPKLPGIYKYFNKKWDIIYIWKSINLFSRVNSYFNNKNKLNFAKKNMVKQINKIETIITNNETESLILESTLIKKYLPKYNILLKDWKNHLYIKITKDNFPKIIKTRIKNNNWIYFWPYLNTNYVNNILKIIKKHFWYGIENHNFFWNSKNYNLDKYLFKNSINSDNSLIKEKLNEKLSTKNYNPLNNILINKEYNKQIENIKYFLKWNFKELIKNLEIKMINFAKNLKFEEANKIKNSIESLKSLDIDQNVKDKVNWNYNIINFIEKFDSFHVWLTEIIDSKIIWYNNYEIINKLWETKNEIIKNFVINLILEKKSLLDINEKIRENSIFILPINIDLKEDIFTSIKIEIPKKWPKLELLKLTYKNIYKYAYEKYLNSLSTKWFTKKNMINILNILWYKQINKDIIFECNDVSHLSWTHTVASRSIIINWKSDTSKYKKFNIKSLENQKIDDFWSMKEIMQRRLKEIEKTWLIPDLIIIDWWKWQLSSVLKIITSLTIEQSSIHLDPLKDKEKKQIYKKMQIVSIAKKEEELFIPWKKDPIILKKDGLELRIIQKIRDEAHRFAISFNRDKRIKSMKKNILDSLPWFWPKTRKKILTRYWSIENLDWITSFELKKILNKSQLETLKDHGII